MPAITDVVDNSTAVAPTDTAIPSSNIGFKIPSSSGWGPNPVLQDINQTAATKHFDENAPKVAAIFASQKPDATGEDRIKAASALKAYTSPGNNEDFKGSHDTRWEKVFSAPNIGEAITAFTGGSDIREIGRSGDGTPVTTVYNSRGDLRRYEWGDGTKITPEQMQQLGPIASTRDISAERATAFKAKGMSADIVGKATAQDWGKTLLAGAGTFAIDSDAAIDINNRIKGLSTELLPNSVNPATRELLAGIGTLTSNKAQQASIAKSVLERFSNGSATKEDYNEYKKNHGGVLGTWTYTQGKGLTNANGTTVDNTQLNDASSQIAASNSSESKISANAQNLANLAQTLAAKGEIGNLDKIQELIRLTAQASNINKRFEAVGGVPGFKGGPDVAHTVTDSFSLAHTNAEYGLAQAKAAKAYSEFIRQKQQELGYQAPPLGSVAAEFANSELAGNLRKERMTNASEFLKSSKAVMDKLNAENVYPQIQTQVVGTPVVPPTAATPTAKVAQPAKASVPKGAAAPSTSNASVLDTLFPRKK